MFRVIVFAAVTAIFFVVTVFAIIAIAIFAVAISAITIFAISGGCFSSESEDITHKLFILLAKLLHRILNSGYGGGAL